MESLEIFQQLVPQFIQTFIILGAACLVFVVIRRALLTLTKRANVPKLAFNPIIVVLRFVTFIVAAIMVAKVFGYDGSGILGGLMAVAGLVAIGFVAVWSVLSNMLCTFVLIIFNPFSVGDELEIPAENIAGTVVDVSLIFTTLSHKDGAMIQIPNNMFFQKVFTRRRGRKSIDLQTQLVQDKPAV